MGVEIHNGLPSWEHLNNETYDEYNTPPTDEDTKKMFRKKNPKEFRDPLNPMIMYACGHRAEKRWASPEIDSTNPDYYKENGLCPDCYMKFKRMDPVYASVVNKKVWALPELTGSEKQISWAETVRYKAAAVNYFISNSKIEIKEILPDMLKTEKSSKFWIDHRYEIYKKEDALCSFIGIHWASKFDISFQEKENPGDIEISVEVTEPIEYLKNHENIEDDE
ncbi:MAG: hypothetical protein HPY53_11085 [Brevinematales bacterium]|nr:hypothetical protein [Brevinematales bacterium]